MRRVAVIGAAAVAAAVSAAWIFGSRRRSTTAVPGNLPGGGVTSALNSWLNGPLYRLVAEALDLRPDDELLDVACGEGAFLAEHASSVSRIAGLDLSATKVALARQRLANRIAAETGDILRGDAGTLPWDDGRFTVVTCMDAFPLFPDPETVLSEICRVLRPGGRAVTQVGWWVAKGTETHQILGGLSWVWSEAEVRRMAKDAGFDDVSICCAPIAGDNRLGNLLGRLMMGTDEIRIVAAMKPLPSRGREEAAATTAVA